MHTQLYKRKRKREQNKYKLEKVNLNKNMYEYASSEDMTKGCKQRKGNLLICSISGYCECKGKC